MSDGEDYSADEPDAQSEAVPAVPGTQAMVEKRRHSDRYDMEEEGKNRGGRETESGGRRGRLNDGW